MHLLSRTFSNCLLCSFHCVQVDENGDKRKALIYTRTLEETCISALKYERFCPGIIAKIPSLLCVRPLRSVDGEHEAQNEGII